MSTINVDYIQSASQSYVTIDTDLAVNGEVTPLWPKIYTALLSQSGSNDPTVVELQNTIGTIIWTRIGPGEYLGTGAGAFSTQDKVLCLSGNNDSDSTSLKWNSPDDVFLMSFDSTHAPIDAVLNYTTVEIRVYN